MCVFSLKLQEGRLEDEGGVCAGGLDGCNREQPSFQDITTVSLITILPFNQYNQSKANIMNNQFSCKKRCKQIAELQKQNKGEHETFTDISCKL